MDNKKSMNIVWAIIICLALVAVVVFISIKNKGNMPTDNNTNSANEINKEVDTTKEPIKNDDAGVVSGVVKAGDTIAVNYTGRLSDGKVFDSNVDPKFGHAGQPLVFAVGQGQMIPGFDKGVLGMKIGDKKTLTLAPEDAYGASGRPPVIPPNATLIFEVELLAIKE